MTFIKHIFWYVVELIIWYLFFYAILFTAKNIEVVNIAWMSFVILLSGSLGVFANPLTRHLSVWNKILDQIIKREEEAQKY
jgi:hypothetical protein